MTDGEPPESVSSGRDPGQERQERHASLDADHDFIPGPEPSTPPPSYLPDAGFYVERVGRAGLRYYEGGRSLLIDAEMLVTKGFAIYTDSIERWDPPDASAISAEERTRIVENVRLALASQGEEALIY